MWVANVDCCTTTNVTVRVSDARHDSACSTKHRVLVGTAVIGVTVTVSIMQISVRTDGVGEEKTLALNPQYFWRELDICLAPNMLAMGAVGGL